MKLKLSGDAAHQIGCDEDFSLYHITRAETHGTSQGEQQPAHEPVVPGLLDPEATQLSRTIDSNNNHRIEESLSSHRDDASAKRKRDQIN